MEEEKRPDKSALFERDERYLQAMQQIAAGDDEAAVANLRRLVDLYPGEGALRDLLVRTELRTAFVMPEELPTQHGRPTPILRRAILFLMFVTVLLAGIVAFSAAYREFYERDAEIHRQEREVADLWEEGYQRLARGDLVGARQVFETLGQRQADGQQLEEAFRLLDEESVLVGLYEQAAEAMARDEWSESLALLLRIQEVRPDFRDVSEKIEQLRQREALETAWAEAEQLVQAEDWPAALSKLTWIRGVDPDFRRGQVEERLFQIYALLARQELEQARGDVGQVESAIEHLREALILRPTQQDLIEEQRLARRYVTGARAYALGDWVAAAEAWEPVYLARQGYQDGVLARRMQETYPRAAAVLIEQADGAEAKLQQAVHYLEQALIIEPEDQELLAERHFALEYLAGAEAFAKERWAEAIEHWGPIHDLRPDYQGGFLEENLKTSCANSPTLSETWCP